MGTLARGILGLVLKLAMASAWAQTASSGLQRSGFDDMHPSTQAMQRDDQQNPGMLWVADGQALFSQPPAAGAKSCADCHERGPLRGVAALYPAWDEPLGRPVSLAQRINLCRERRQQAAPLAFESAPLLGLEAYVAHLSRGMSIAPRRDAKMESFVQRGQALFQRRIGQVNLSCAQCHDKRAGKRLGGNVIPQGHPTGYPVYRLEWQGVGSLERRIRACMTGIRAEPFAPYSDDMVALQAYLMKRAAGMVLETPAVRP